MTRIVTEPTHERKAFDRLVNLYSFFDVLEIDWQRSNEARTHAGPWIIVKLGQRSDDRAEAWVEHTYAILKETGAIHGVRHDGAVTDFPLPI